MVVLSCFAVGWFVFIFLLLFQAAFFKRQVVPLNLRIRPWWTVRSMIVDAMVVSPITEGQRENSRFVV